MWPGYSDGNNYFDLLMNSLTKKWTVSKFDGSFILTERERIEKDFNQEPRKKTLHKNYEMICISFSEVSIWAPFKTWFSTCWRNPC